MATAATASAYRALSEDCPDTIILFYQPSAANATGSAGVAISSSRVWHTAIGDVHSDEIFVTSLLRRFPELHEAAPDPAVTAQADWVMYLSADYADAPHDPLRSRPHMLTPKMVAIAVESPDAQTIRAVSEVRCIPRCIWNRWLSDHDGVCRL